MSVAEDLDYWESQKTWRIIGADGREHFIRTNDKEEMFLWAREHRWNRIEKDGLYGFTEYCSSMHPGSTALDRYKP